MALLTWKDSFSVGVREIDAQHQKIFELINQLYSAIVNIQEHKIIDAVVDDLIDYSHYHFGTEEKYFDLYNYPDKERHEVAHKTYIEKVNKFKQDAADKKEALPRGVLTFLEDWWTKHVMTADKGYSSFFNQHGLN